MSYEIPETHENRLLTQAEIDKILGFGGVKEDDNTLYLEYKEGEEKRAVHFTKQLYIRTSEGWKRTAEAILETKERLGL